MTPSSQPRVAYRVTIYPTRLTNLLVLAVLVLLANHVMLQVSHYQAGQGHWLVRQLFDVDEEDTIPTWFATALLLFCAQLLYAIATAKSRQANRFFRHWLGLAIGFLLLSIDEVAGLHEILNTAIDVPWTIPAAFLLAIVALAYVRFLLHLPAGCRIRFVLAGALFVGGAVGVEHATDGYWMEYGSDNLGYNLLTALEEGCEMFGIVLFISALLGYISQNEAHSIALGPMVEEQQPVCETDEPSLKGPLAEVEK